MVVTKSEVVQKEISWKPGLIRRLRGKRTQAQLGDLLGVPKNTVWRWEAGYAAPGSEHARRLTTLATKERFPNHWKLAGSMTLLGDIEEGSGKITEKFIKSLLRSARQL